MENELDTSNIPPQPQNEAYGYALQLKFYEGQISWQMHLLFIALNVGIATLLGDGLSKNPKLGFFAVFLSLSGIIINILWLGTFKRNNRYYEFRMAQARNLEPANYNLVNGRGHHFSKGLETRFPTVDGTAWEVYRLSSFEKFCSNKLAILLCIWIFIIGFIFLSLYFLSVSYKLY